MKKIIASAGAFALFIFAFGPLPVPKVSANTGNLSAQALQLVNAERTKAGLPALALDTRLTQAAQTKANSMAASGYFEHTGPNGKAFYKWIDETGYKYTIAGENLANSPAPIDVDLIVRMWMNSPTHRANIMSGKFRETGVAASYGMYNGMPAVFIAQEFASPQAPASVQSGILASPAAPTIVKSSVVKTFVEEPTKAQSEPAGEKTNELVVGSSVFSATSLELVLGERKEKSWLANLRDKLIQFINKFPKG